MTRHRVTVRIPLAFLTLLLGIGILAQFRVQRRTGVVASIQEEQALLLSELVEANGRLRSEIRSLESQLAAYEEDSRGVGIQGLVAELNKVKVLNGQVEVSGPGIELLVDGPLSALDLQDLVNELRNAGAEAVSLNGHRLIATSVLRVETKGHLVVDGHSITRPYLFEAIGDFHTLETALLRPGGLLYLQRRSYPNLSVTTSQQTRLVLGIHHPHIALGYAQPVP